MALVRSIVLSILLSVLATVAARRLLSVSQPSGNGEQPGRERGNVIVVVVPALVGNSNNRIGYVKEVHNYPRPLFGRRRSRGD